MEKSNKNIGWIILLLVVIAVGVSIFSLKKGSSTESMEQDVVEETMVNEGAMEADGDKMESDVMEADGVIMEDKMVDQDDAMTDESQGVISLELSNYKFSQKIITAKAGQTVTIELKNTEGFHDFVIDELGVASEQITEGQEVSVTFTIPENASGKVYQYYCSVGNHRELGMVGTLQVE